MACIIPMSVAVQPILNIRLATGTLGRTEPWLYKKHLIVNNYNNELIWFEILKTDNMFVAGVYACLWRQCGFESADSNEIMRHVNFHSYHTKLKCIGSNTLARLRLPVSEDLSAPTCFTHLVQSAYGDAQPHENKILNDTALSLC
jgi:hypothetical protein